MAETTCNQLRSQLTSRRIELKYRQRRLREELDIAFIKCRIPRKVNPKDIFLSEDKRNNNSQVVEWNIKRGEISDNARLNDGAAHATRFRHSVDIMESCHNLARSYPSNVNSLSTAE